jgi:hypothetical protein
MAWLMDILNKAIRKRFSGQIEINFQMGGITNVNIKQSLKEGAEVAI